MENIENPFLTKAYISPKYFCNRNLETSKLASALKNGRNCTLFSIRKYGKTGTISQLFWQNPDKNNAFVDIFSTQNVVQLANAIGKVVMPKLETHPQKLGRWIGTIFSSIKPSISFDSYTGQPSVELGIQTEAQAFKSLDELFRWIKNWGGELWLALDEFQQINQYPEKGTEAHLRSLIQFCPNVKVIFSGSQRNLLVNMFTDYGRPFYQSTDLMELKTLDKKEYLAFIQNHFENGKRQFEEEIMADWLDKLRIHTYYVQLAMNKLYAAKPRKWKRRDYDHFFYQILAEQEVQYVTIRNLLTDLQWRVLEAIALEGNVEKATGKDWLMRYKLGSASSMQAVIAAMEEREMIVREEKGFRLMDPMMEHWFKQIYSPGKYF